MQSESIVTCQFSTKPNKEMHFHQDIEIIYVLDGVLEVIFEKEEKLLKTDEFLLVNTNVRHCYRSKGEVLVGSIFIDYIQLMGMFGGGSVYFLCNSAEEKSESYDNLRYFIRQLFNYYHTDEGQGNILRNSIAYQLLYILTSEFIVKKGMRQYESLRGISDERMNDILNELMTNFREQITLQGLADKLYLSNAYLSKYIKKNFGMSFLKLLNNIRMEHAVSELIYSDKMIVRIALDSGFPNLTGFNRTFREIYHMTPAEYRKETLEKRETVKKEEADKETLKRVENYLTYNKVEVKPAEDLAVTSVEADAQISRAMDFNWNQMLNAGRAEDLLRFDYREHVRYLIDKLKIKYVRIWNVISDEMMIQLDENKSEYNFNLLDKVFDFILQIEAKPFVEMGFKTKEIYENIQHNITGGGDLNQFKILEKNKGFLVEFVKHLVKRYGVEEVETWYFELEKNPVLKTKVDPSSYAETFQNLYHIFKSYIPNVKIGGAGLCLNYVEKDFVENIRIWKKKNLKLDFLSIYSYPYIMNEDLLDGGRNAYSSDESYLYNQIREAKRICAEEGFDIPRFFVTEWSNTLSNRNPINDSCYKSAYVMKNLIQSSQEADMIGYWVATDLFSDYYDTKRILFGGCGLITRDMIRKSVFYAYSFLNKLEKNLLSKSRNAIITGDNKKRFSICCHNYRHFNFRYYLQEENEIPFERLNTLYENNESLQINFKIRNVQNGTYQVKKYYVNRDHGDIQAEWGKIGYYDDLSATEIEYYREITQPGMQIESLEVTNEVLEIETILKAQEVQTIIITEQ